MGASQSQTPTRNSPRSSSMRGHYRTLSNQETSSQPSPPSDQSSAPSRRPSNGRSQSMREPRGDRPVRSRPRVRPRENLTSGMAGQAGQSSSSESSPDSLPPMGLLERLRRLNLDEDYDFISFNQGIGTLSVSAPANPLSLLRRLTGARRVKCPVCGDQVQLDDLEEHMKVCLQKPRVQYNLDVLQNDGGECSICLEDIKKGSSIARLPCLCIYHQQCLEMWYKKSQTCPAHPECVQLDHPSPSYQMTSASEQQSPVISPAPINTPPRLERRHDPLSITSLFSGTIFEEEESSVQAKEPFGLDLDAKLSTSDEPDPEQQAYPLRVRQPVSATSPSPAGQPRPASSRKLFSSSDRELLTLPTSGHRANGSSPASPGSQRTRTSQSESGASPLSPSDMGSVSARRTPSTRRMSGASSPLATTRMVAHSPTQTVGSAPRVSSTTPALPTASKDRITGPELGYTPERPALETLLTAN